MPVAVPILPTKCLVCDAELRTPVVCERCHSLCPAPASADHFALLGIGRTYDLDSDELDRRFIVLSREIHPDFYGDKPAGEQDLAIRVAADVNQAHRVLKDPVLRAEYLLELSGGESAARDKSLPEGFLAEIMTLREEVEEALASGDHAKLDEHQRHTAAARDAARARIGELARKLPAAGPDEKRQLRRALNSIKYYDNVLKLLA